MTTIGLVFDTILSYSFLTWSTSARHSSSVMSKKGIPRSDACWMKAIRGIPTNSAALPLEI